MQLTKVSRSIKQDLWREVSFRKSKLILKRHLLQEVRYTSFRTIMALASVMKCDLHQMDVKTTFLNGVIEEEVYIEQPQGFEVQSDSCMEVEKGSVWAEASS